MTSKLLVSSFLLAVVACSGAKTDDVPADAGALPATPAPTGTGPGTSQPPPSTPPEPPADAGTDAAASGDAGTMTYCEFRTKTCNKTAASCTKEVACMSAMRPGIGDALQSCVLAKKACNQLDDCMEVEVKKIENVPDAKAFRDACLARRTACGPAIGIPDDYCLSLFVFPQPTLALFETCLSKPCGDVEDCMDAELTKLGCD